MIQTLMEHDVRLEYLEANVFTFAEKRRMFDMLDELVTKVNRLDEERLVGVHRFERIEARLDSIDTHLDEQQKWNRTINARLDEQQKWNEKIDTRFDEQQKWNEKIEAHLEDQQRWNQRINAHFEGQQVWNHKIQTHLGIT